MRLLPRRLPKATGCFAASAESATAICATARAGGAGSAATTCAVAVKSANVSPATAAVDGKSSHVLAAFTDAASNYAAGRGLR